MSNNENKPKSNINIEIDEKIGWEIEKLFVDEMIP